MNPLIVAIVAVCGVLAVVWAIYRRLRRVLPGTWGRVARLEGEFGTDPWYVHRVDGDRAWITQNVGSYNGLWVPVRSIKTTRR